MTRLDLAPVRHAAALMAGIALAPVWQMPGPPVHAGPGITVRPALALVSGLGAADTAVPLALASADLDEDGTADLVAAYRAGGAGVVVVHRGDPAALYPNEPAFRRRAAAPGAAPFFPPGAPLAVAVAPAFLAAGDFDADGHADLVVADGAEAALWLLAGDGRGGLGARRRVGLPGRVTALAAAEVGRRDGLPDLVVATAAAGGRDARLSVLGGGRGALRASPESLGLPAPATALAVGNLDDDYRRDVAVAAGRALWIVHAVNAPGAVLGRVERLELAFAPVAVAAADLDGDGRTDLALGADEGPVRLADRRGAGGAWRLGEAWRLGGGAASLTAARISSRPHDDLVAIDTASGGLWAAPPGPRPAGRAGAAGVDVAGPAVALEAGEPAAAVLALRLNGDALDDLVVLGARSGRVRVVLSAAAATLTVNSAGDEADKTPGDGACLTDKLTCTLRAALDEANATDGADLVRFGIGTGPQTIRPATPLPVVFEALTIDGTTQPGFAGAPLVEIDGSAIVVDEIGAGAGADGIVLVNGGSTVRGLVVNRFDGSGIALAEGKKNVIEGNYLGTDRTGTEDLGNRSQGVKAVRSGENTIGGTTAQARNVIAGNNEDGVLLGEIRSSGNKVQGNTIGLSAAGDAPLGNGLDGVLAGGAPDNVVGGLEPGAGNVIAGNAGDGVQLDSGGARGNLVQGNLIGPGAAGAAGNLGRGVFLDDAPENTIGGTVAAAANVITRNGGDGVTIAGSGARANLVQRNTIAGGGDGVRVDGAAANGIGGVAGEAGNVISGNAGDGVEITGSGASGNVVRGNLIGLAATGFATGNAGFGVLVSGAPGNSVGGDWTVGNVVSDNAAGGVAVVGLGAIGNLVQGNFIGTDTNGEGGHGNGGEGVLVLGAPGNIIGRPAGEGVPINGNLIAGNEGDGIRLAGAGADRNRVAANRIGMNRTQTFALANAGDGVAIVGGARRNTIEDNTLAGNARHGVSVAGSGTDDNVITINTIGTRTVSNAGDGVLVGAGAQASRVESNHMVGNLHHGIEVRDPSTAGTTASGNVVEGNGGMGVVIHWAQDSIVGPDNSLAGNAAGGVWITGAIASGNVVRRNRIGLGTLDLPGGNGGPGVRLDGSASGNRIEENHIGYNAGPGVAIVDGERNAVLSNRILPNDGLGIELGSPGANAGRAYPQWSGAAQRSGAVEGTVAGPPGAVLELQLFLSRACDRRGRGPGEWPVASRSVTVAADGTARFALDLTADLAGANSGSAGQLTATATDALGNTSEFSACAALVVPRLYVPYGAR